MEGPGDLCESISKIIRFAVATHFRLPPPIMALSGEDDRLQLRVEARPLLFNPSSVPPETSIPSFHQYHLIIYIREYLELLHTLQTLKCLLLKPISRLCIPVLLLCRQALIVNNNEPNKRLMLCLQSSLAIPHYS